MASVIQAGRRDRQQLVQRLIHPPEVTDVAPVDGPRVVAELVIGQLEQGIDLVEEHCQALEIGVEGGGLGVHGGLGLIDDVPIHALNDQEAKRCQIG